MRYSFLLAALVCILCSACSPTISKQHNFSEITFVPGTTTKNDVINVLGLPSDISRSERLQQEYWAYDKGSERTGIVWAAPSGANTVSAYATSLDTSAEYKFENAAVIYIFDGKGTLINQRLIDEK